jgi:hypothetical protein
LRQCNQTEYSSLLIATLHSFSNKLEVTDSLMHAVSFAYLMIDT